MYKRLLGLFLLVAAYPLQIVSQTFTCEKLAKDIVTWNELEQKTTDAKGFDDDMMYVPTKKKEPAALPWAKAVMDAGLYSVDANGDAISLSGRKTTFASTHSNNPVLTAEEAAVYSDMDAMYGDWNPTQYTAQADVSNVVLNGNTLTWEGSSDAYLIEKNGEFVALTSETSYTVEDGETYTVRAANGRGGFGEAVENTAAAPLILTTSQNMAGYRTFYDAENSYVADENTIVYVAKLKRDTEVVLSRLSDKVVPANTPVILKTTGLKENGTADAHYQITLTPSDETDYYIGVNLLAVTTDGQDLSAGAYYRLGWDAEDGVAFRLWNPSSASAGIVYLNVPSSLGAKFSIIFDEEEEVDPTAVNAVTEAGETMTDGAAYNAAGQRVGKAYKGLVIRNGKKYYNK